MSRTLPLSAMEEFFFWDDRPAYPCDCFVRLRFSGRLDRPAFERATLVALARHPLLRAKVEIVGRRLQWSVVEGPAPVVTWEMAPVGGPLPPARHIDLEREMGVRFHLRSDARTAASELTIQFHHACCDASGFASFLCDLLLSYAGEALPPLDSGLLAGRGRFGLGAGKLLRMLPRQLVGLLGARQFLMRRPVPIVPHQACADDSPLPADYPATLGHTFDREATAALRQTAKRREVTTNDLLACDFFLALAEWRARQNAADDGWLRMMVPVSLRRESDAPMPAANVVSTVFLDRRGSDFADAGDLLRGIHAEMDLIKRNQLGYTFVFSLAVCRRLFGGLRKQVRADKCTVSCVLTNVGGLYAQLPLPRRDGQIAVGNLTVTNIESAAPIHPYSCATVVAGLYADRLGITLHYDPRPLVPSQAADLLATFVQQIETSIAAAGPRSAPLGAAQPLPLLETGHAAAPVYAPHGT
jgi:hypothetical protein